MGFDSFDGDPHFVGYFTIGESFVPVKKVSLLCLRGKLGQRGIMHQS